MRWLGLILLLFGSGCYPWVDAALHVQKNPSCFADADGDGFGAAKALVAKDCKGRTVRNGDDCDDDDPTRFPGADELCDGIPNDCAAPPVTPKAELDNDGDGYVSCTPAEGVEWKGTQIDGWGDCADDDPDTRPGLTERCDGLDNDCDGPGPYDPVNYPALGWDCDDQDALVYPGSGC